MMDYVAVVRCVLRFRTLKKHLVITQIPFSTNTTTLIDSILKPMKKVKSKIEDNTAANVEILIHLYPVSPDKTIDALFSFTACETSVAPLGCVIEDNKPLFVGVSHMLRISTERTQDLLRQELEIQLEELKINGIFLPRKKSSLEKKCTLTSNYIQIGKLCTNTCTIALNRFHNHFVSYCR
jgi:DNA gyrase/topoisomerase IV subunit A